MLIGFIHNRLSKKNAPTGGRLSGQEPDDIFRGRGKDVSEEKHYVSAARNSVTGVTSCAAKVGLLITCLMDCGDMADWRLIRPNQTRGRS